MKQLRQDLDFTRTYGSMPDSFERRVQYALRQTEEKKTARHPFARTIAIALVLLTLTTVACAAVFSHTAEVIGFIFGQQKKEELLAGELAVSGRSYRMGDVIYTVDDAVWTHNALYASGTIRAAEGADIILIPEDYEVDDPAGYSVHYDPDEAIPDDAPTYRQLAESSGANLVQVWCHILNNIDPNDHTIFGDSGSSLIAQPDGSVVFACDFYPTSVDMETLRSGDCIALFRVSQHQLTLDGRIIEETIQFEDWPVPINPQN